MKRLSFLIPFIISALSMTSMPFSYTNQAADWILCIISIVSMAIGVYFLANTAEPDTDAADRKSSSHSIEQAVQHEQHLLLQSLRHARHDWLNHFQVLLGYLKLGRYDVCEDYIKKVTEATNKDSRIAQLGYQPLVAYLLTHNVLYGEMTLEVDLPEAIDLNQFPYLDQSELFALIKGLVEIYRTHSLPNDEAPNTLVILIKVVDLALYLSVEFEGSLDEDGCLKSLRRLVSRFGNEDGFFVEGLHNSRESIMEFYFPLVMKEEVLA